ncbi:SMI1/KNR4 family protein [Roseimicrobium sp. ORNL1]|uniref:SMI1/KNR4 family protein n=1 Tax=Roseimicrobium sp. ORNL1 TaxID=2711231 RepID=UPI0013E106BD|nr:SMI1/KNR4 family protein [Roseimicrobium sp. ORNL1]QIF04039.1 SMI1/KNR4 family protein [Roseimicrobium sp. ORNL1]
MSFRRGVPVKDPKHWTFKTSSPRRLPNWISFGPHRLVSKALRDVLLSVMPEGIEFHPITIAQKGREHEYFNMNILTRGDVVDVRKSTFERFSDGTPMALLGVHIKEPTETLPPIFVANAESLPTGLLCVTESAAITIARAGFTDVVLIAMPAGKRHDFRKLTSSGEPNPFSKTSSAPLPKRSFSWPDPNTFTTPSLLLGAKMSKPQVQAIHTAFGVQLPDYYLQFLRKYPAILDKTANDLDGLEPLSQEVVPKDAAKLIDMNAIVRQPETFWLEDEEGELPWPSSYWAIGFAAADYYCIDTASRDQTVYLTNHEESNFVTYAANLGEFVSKLVAETEADLQDLREEMGLLDDLDD